MQVLSVGLGLGLGRNTATLKSFLNSTFSVKYPLDVKVSYPSPIKLHQRLKVTLLVRPNSKEAVQLDMNLCTIRRLGNLTSISVTEIINPTRPNVTVSYNGLKVAECYNELIGSGRRAQVIGGSWSISIFKGRYINRHMFLIEEPFMGTLISLRYPVSEALKEFTNIDRSLYWGSLTMERQ
jgi:hypothetical protein